MGEMLDIISVTVRVSVWMVSRIRNFGEGALEGMRGRLGTCALLAPLVPVMAVPACRGSLGIACDAI